MKLVLYPHGGSGNHGCEAIVRSTQKITKAETILFSSNPAEDIKSGLNRLCLVMNDKRTLSKGSCLYWKAFVDYHLLKDREAFDKAVFSPVIAAGEKADLVLSIGGDNYCYGAPAYIYLINRELRKRGVKTILWGCSIEPKSLQGEMLDDLRGYTHIFARESITFEALKAAGLRNVSLYPDPAFQLDKVELPLPEGFMEGNTVGINVSPMIIGKEQKAGITLRNYVHLIDYIIEHTDMQVALIPHVVWPHNDDRQPLTLLFEKFRHTGRVVMIGDHNAEELKGYIARCRIMVAARTHASVAAYSSKVPTLVVGYSVKARGIAKDIFGTEQNYVVPVQSMLQVSDLADAFGWLMRHEHDIREHYGAMMSDYIYRTMEASDVLKKYDTYYR